MMRRWPGRGLEEVKKVQLLVARQLLEKILE